MNTSTFFDLLITGSGFYLIYIAIIMKKKGEIKQGVIVSKDVDIDKIRDKKGFIDYMFSRLLLVGVLTIAAGMVSLLNTYFTGPSYISIIIVVIYLLVLILFTAATVKARKKYID